MPDQLVSGPEYMEIFDTLDSRLREVINDYALGVFDIRDIQAVAETYGVEWLVSRLRQIEKEKGYANG